MARLKNRIDRLESATGTALDEDARKMLVALVGRRDGLFWPSRTTGRHQAEIAQRQRAYHAGGGVTAKAEGKHNWRDTHRTRNRLIDAALVEANHAGGQVIDMRPTPTGEAVVRATVERLRTVAESLPLLARLVELGGKSFLGRNWVAEGELFEPLEIECVGNPQTWDVATEYMLPALVHNLAVARCDTVGRVHYSLNGESHVPTEHECTSRTDIDDECYMSAFKSEMRSLANAENTSGEVVIPLPASW